MQFDIILDTKRHDIVPHEYSEPVYITKNGKGDLAILSIEAYEKLAEKYEMYRLLNEGMKAEEAGIVYPAIGYQNEI